MRLAPEGGGGGSGRPEITVVSAKKTIPVPAALPANNIASPLWFGLSSSTSNSDQGALAVTLEA